MDRSPARTARRRFHTVSAFLIAASCVFAGAPSARAQDDIPTLKVDVKVINVLASVRNKNGDIVRNLTKDDFTLTEDGRLQTIRYFSQQSDLPLTLGLLVDTSTSQRRVLGEERDASVVFLDQLLRLDRDNAFVLHFDFDVELLQDLTSSRQKLRSALDELELPERGGMRPGGGRGSRRGGWGGGGTAMYDSIYLAADEVMRNQHGRKAVVILSDGVDNGSKLSLSDAIEAAQRADMMVYSILFSDASAYGGGFGFGFPGGRRGIQIGLGMPNGKKVLQQLSRETGGRFFEVSDRHPIREIYSSIQEELRNQYNIGYSSDRPYDGGYRKLRLTARSKDLTVQARDGFYARR
jgi:VWFA-related protein